MFLMNYVHHLQACSSYIEALADGAWQDPDLAPRFLEVTQNETDRMIRMIQDLFQLSRIDSGKSMLNLEIVDLTEMLDHVLNRFDMMIHSAEYEDKKYQINKEILEQSISLKSTQIE